MDRSVLLRIRLRASVSTYRVMRRARRGLVLGLGTAAAVLASASLLGRTAWSTPLEPTAAAASAVAARPAGAPWVVGSPPAERVAPAPPVSAGAAPVPPAVAPLPAVAQALPPAPVPAAAPAAPAAPANAVGAAPPVELLSQQGVNVGIPALAYAAYQRAAIDRAHADPSCHLPWTLLAAIGKVESDHGGNGNLNADGTTLSPILGPALDGRGGTAAVPSTDGGLLTQDRVWDHAVGPMQFIPSTWKHWAQAGRPDAQADPNNIFDATTTAGAYLCSNHRDLSDPQQMTQAIGAYNHSNSYVREVLSWVLRYSSGNVELAPATTATTEPSADEPTPSNPQELADGTGPASVTIPRPHHEEHHADKPPHHDGGSAPQHDTHPSPEHTQQPSSPPAQSQKPTSEPATTPSGSPNETASASPSGPASTPTSTTPSPSTSTSASASPSASAPTSTSPTPSTSPTASASARPSTTSTAAATPSAPSTHHRHT